jgi:hypothetical protein
LAVPCVSYRAGIIPLETTMTHDIYRDERATWEHMRQRLLAENAGRWVVIRGADVGGVYDDRRSAVAAGRRRWGNVPIYVRHITAEEETEFLPIFDFATWGS